MELFNAISNNRTWNRHGTKIAICLAIFCFLLAITFIGMNIYNNNKIKQINYTPQIIKKITNSGPNYSVNNIVAANLFGNPNPPKLIQNAPKTTLDLTLQGILWASDNTLARAIIMSGKKNSGLYSIGEEIKGAGVSIKEIRDNEVLLNRNGAIESLPLIKNSKSGNQQIITYEDTLQNASNKLASPPNIDIQASFNKAESTGSSGSRIVQTARGKPIPPDAKPRKLRRPNFSGLDRALKKLGEI